VIRHLDRSFRLSDVCQAGDVSGLAIRSIINDGRHVYVVMIVRENGSDVLPPYSSTTQAQGVTMARITKPAKAAPAKAAKKKASGKKKASAKKRASKKKASSKKKSAAKKKVTTKKRASKKRATKGSHSSPASAPGAYNWPWPQSASLTTVTRSPLAAPWLSTGSSIRQSALCSD